MYLVGRKNLGPDAASRHPAGVPESLPLPGEASDADTQADTPISCCDALPGLYKCAGDIDMADDISTVSAATCALNAVVSVVTWDMIREATASDPMDPDDGRELPTDLRPYHCFAASLYVVDGVILMLFPHHFASQCSMQLTQELVQCVHVLWILCTGQI